MEKSILGMAMITREKWQQLHVRMYSLGIHEDDLIEKFILGSGSGGQKINKTSSTVWLKHESTGMSVKCQKARSRELNRYYARERLCDKIDEQKNKINSERQQAIAKVKRQKRKRSKRAKEKMLADKKYQSKRKQGRRVITE
jgi:protein subunit release factor B